MLRTLISQTPNLIGQTATICGWVDAKRDHGKVTFVDLRDRSGVVQTVGVKKMAELTPESVVSLTGLVKQRPAKLINSDLPTGNIEIEVTDYTVLNLSQELPIPVKGDGYEIAEENRLKYRYLDLRRQRSNHLLRKRSKLVQALRDNLYPHDFVEIETPLLTQSTKEGARDFLVPSRFQPGKFYALPQSPQQYKQLLMTAGFENYFQVAKCVRDEDLRADRGFEFTQLDLEMSFVERADVMQLVESIVITSVETVQGSISQKPFPVLTYQQAIEQYGSDRPDLRTNAEKADGRLHFCWIVDFPFFKKVDTADVAEVRDGKSGWTFTHNPFSAPLPEYLDDHMSSQNIENILTSQYDLVCNGWEVGGGSIRAHRPEVLRQTFKIMGYSDDEIEASVGHMLQAFAVGTPPHGGIALGLDRLVALLGGESSLKEAIAFPMTKSGRISVMQAPVTASPDQLKELGLSTTHRE